MPYTRDDLKTKYSLDDEGLVKTLQACGLRGNKARFSQEDVDNRIGVVRSYFEQGMVTDYPEAAELFKQQPREDESGKTYEILELLSMASQRGMSVSLTDALSLLQCCGLPDEPQYKYSEEDADKFLEGCEMVKLQGKTYAEVAIHFGINFDTKELQAEGGDDSGKQVAEATLNLEAAASVVIDNMTRRTAKAAAPLVAPLFMTHLAQELRSEEIREQFDRLEEQLKVSLGNGQARMRRAILERNSMPPSSEKPNALPEGSSDG